LFSFFFLLLFLLLLLLGTAFPLCRAIAAGFVRSPASCLPQVLFLLLLQLFLLLGDGTGSPALLSFLASSSFRN
jgi:hypothetical protein